MYIAGGDSDDLIQEGMLGLFKAVKDFDETRDVTFSSFASMCVNRQIMTAVTISNRKKIHRSIPMYHLIHHCIQKMSIVICTM